MKKLTLLIAALAITFLGISTTFAESLDKNAVEVNSIIYVNGTKYNPERQIVAINGRTLIPAKTAFEALNASINWKEQDGEITISKNGTEVKMKIGDMEYSINNKTQSMDAYPILIRGTVMVPARFVAQALGINVGWDPVHKAVILGKEPQNLNVSRGESSTFTVVIDPGHGGRDPGAIYGGVKEKDLNLAIAKRLNILLKNNGIKTYMTRTTDTYVGLYTRSGLANKVNADLLISIHNNAGYSRMTGSMSLYYPSTSKSNGNLSALEFANIVQAQLTGSLGQKNLGVIARPHLAVLRTSNMPAVIAEVGYMTNLTELKKLKSYAFQQKTAEALKNAVLQALKRI